MNLSEYQQLAQRTANTDMTFTLRLATAALGLAGESGEVADIIKKAIGHGHLLETVDIKKELGDVMWYVVEVAVMCGLDLEEIADANIAKLKQRYPMGFSEERSINREE